MFSKPTGGERGGAIRACRRALGSFFCRAISVSGLVLLMGLWAPVTAVDAQIVFQDRPRGSEARSFVQEYNQLVQRSTTPGTGNVPGATAAEEFWSAPSFPVLPFRIPDPLAPDDGAYNQALLRRATSQVTRAAELSEQLQAELDHIEDLRTRISNPLWWKAIDANDALNRQVWVLRDRYQSRLLMLYQQAFETLDRIADSNIAQREDTMTLRQTAYRNFAMHAVALGNYEDALKILLEYHRLPLVDQEWPLHYYLSLCYEARLRRARQDRGIHEATLFAIRREADLHHLRAVELKFGRGSPEFQESLERISRRELGTPRYD